MKKSLIVLQIYDSLLQGEKVNSYVCSCRFGISESTFYRYISVIRAHLWETQMVDVVYDAKNQTYLVVK
ncbi:MAG: hypothetical protein IKC47_01345 [Clostridia bacterium]|nr:hypothetical protein [Clostridia bacterium]